MVAPLLIGAASAIIQSLVQNNLPGMAQAVIDKGVEFVEEKTGVKLSPSMTPEQIEQLRQSEAEMARFLIEQSNKNTADARAMQMKALEQDDVFAKRFVMYLTIFWSVVSTVYIFSITFINIPKDSVRFADTILGFLLGTILATAINFWLGSSSQSASKNGAISDMVNMLRKKEDTNEPR